MEHGRDFQRLVNLMEKLRGPAGCPWDRKQTMDSLRPYVLEEAYELVDAIDSGEKPAILEELGDMLLEVIFVAQIASEQETFTMSDVVQNITDKLIRRHPHVFDSSRAENSGEALAHWNAIKKSEKPEDESVLKNVPAVLPALARAHKLSSRAATVGFDWSSFTDVQAKLKEEIQEFLDAIDSEQQDLIHEEIGDILFSIANLARHLKVNAELALHDTNRKFVKRFHYIEAQLKSSGRTVEEASLNEMEVLWQESKKEK